MLLRSFYGATAVAAATPLRIGPTRDGTAEVLNMLKVSAMPPRRFAVLTVFGGATAINDGTTAEPRRSWRCHCGLCRTGTAVAPRFRCDGGITCLYIYARLHQGCSRTVLYNSLVLVRGKHPGLSGQKLSFWINCARFFVVNVASF